MNLQSKQFVIHQEQIASIKEQGTETHEFGSVLDNIQLLHPGRAM